MHSCISVKEPAMFTKCLAVAFAAMVVAACAATEVPVTRIVEQTVEVPVEVTRIVEQTVVVVATPPATPAPASCIHAIRFFDYVWGVFRYANPDEIEGELYGVALTFDFLFPHCAKILEGYADGRGPNRDEQ